MRIIRNVPLFQAYLLNYVEQMQEYHGIDMTESIPQNFLTLSVSMKALGESVIRAKYLEETASKILDTNTHICLLQIFNTLS